MATAPRVVVFSLYFPPLYSGAALQAILLIRALLARGVDVTVLTALPAPHPAGPADDAARAGARVVRFRSPRRILPRQIVFGIRAALWLLVRSDWDVLHLIGPTYAALLPTCVARLRGRSVLTKTTLLAPTPGAVPTPGLGFLRSVRGWIYQLSGAVVALSEALEEEVRREGGGRPAVHRLPNGVDRAIFHPGSPAEREATRRELGVPKDAFLIASCGEIHRRKRPGVLVEAASRMQRRPAHIVLAGPSGNDPEYEAELREVIGKCPEGVTVARTGTIPVEQVAALLRASDVFVLTSASEGMPNSLLEAMATGLPCVASDIPGSRDVLSRGGGLLVPLDDPAALAAALDQIVADPAVGARLAAEALAVVEAEYSIDRVAERYLAIYRELIGDRAGSAGSSEKPSRSRT
jgi:glycosyltransferase involved in cell wall biosynthesis